MKILVVGASWCRNCLMMRSRLSEVRSETQVTVEYFDFDQNPAVVNLYKLQNASLPACIFLNGQGDEQFRLNGMIGKQKLIDTINRLKQASLI